MGDIPSRLAAVLAERYRVERELARGGMATVYLAQDLRHERRVAIKVLRPEPSESMEEERFHQEIRTTAGLQHPHILPLFDSGAEDGLLWFVMPYVEGESLRERLQRDGQLPVDEAVRIATAVADALHYAHRRGVIHRDVKPANILIHEGRPLVADFGIALVREGRGARITQAGSSLGTPTYMSPEQATADPSVTPRSDVYSLGCVLYEMLVGDPPFAGKSVAAVVARIVSEPPVPVSRVRPSVPRHVSAAVDQALAKSPESRFESAAAFAAALADPASAVVDERPSIAVLPFTNMSGEAENAFLGDGIAEEIVNALAQIPGIRVAARTSAFAFRGRAEDLRAIGQALDVSVVLEGSVRRSGNRLRVTGQLVNVADGFHLWSERYDREMRDVFAIQDEIAAAIVRRLKVTLDVQDKSLVRPGTANVDAYQLYHRGRALLYRRGLNILRARECFEDAITLDPGYALAYAGLADAYLYLAMWGLRRWPLSIPPGKEAVRRALEIDPDLAEAHYAAACIAFFFDCDAKTFMPEFSRAEELKPEFIQARCGRSLYDIGGYRQDYPAAREESYKAVREDPLSAYAATIHALNLYRTGALEEACDEARRATELDAESVVAWWHLQSILGWTGDHEGAVHAGETALALHPGFSWSEGTLAAEYGRAGDAEAARGIYDRMVARTAGAYVQPTWLAIAAVGCGLLDEAMAHLLDAARDRDCILPAILRPWKDLDPLRHRPGFQDIPRALGWT